MARKHPKRRINPGKTHRRRSGGDPTAPNWLYGTHAVLAALANPERVCERALVSDDDDAELAVAAVEIGGHGTVIDRVSRDDVTAVLPQGAVHQGIALLARPLEDHGIEDAMDRALQSDTPCILLLDQVTDPQNVGAILRSAAAFGAAAVVMHDRHAPPVTGALAKAASGGLEAVALVRETNLSRSIEALKARNFWCIGLAGEVETTLAQARVTGPTALVLGAEGAGLRRLVAESCDTLAHIPHSDAVESLNVSNAAAIALYEIARQA